MNSTPTSKPWEVPSPPTAALKRLAEEPFDAAQAARTARSVLGRIRTMERFTALSPAEILAAVRLILEDIATRQPDEFMRRLQEWEAQQ